MPISLPQRVHIVEVGPRDGLQNEARLLPVSTKITFINHLSQAGFQTIEAGAFVHPKRIPQMASSKEVFSGIERAPGVVYAALVPNRTGMEMALDDGVNVDEVVIFGAASESFSQHNIQCSIAQSIERFQPVATLAHAHGKRLRGSISCALGCPYQGVVPPGDVYEVAKRLLDLGCEHIDVADTIGVGTPRQVQTLFEFLGTLMPISRLSGHFHDTYGQALANVYASLEVGITTFHSSIAGLGGCPYAPGATGNVATEDVLYMMQGLGINTGIDLNRIVDIAQFISKQLGQPSRSRAGQALHSHHLRRGRHLSCELV